MAETYYRAEFEYRNWPGLLEPIKPAYEKEYVRVWNLMAHNSEERYAKWNPEFDSLYGQLDDHDCYEYNDFMATKQEEYYETLGSEKSRWMTFKWDRDEFNLVGSPIMIPTAEMRLFLKPVEVD